MPEQSGSKKVVVYYSTSNTTEHTKYSNNVGVLVKPHFKIIKNTVTFWGFLMLTTIRGNCKNFSLQLTPFTWTLVLGGTNRAAH